MKRKLLVLTTCIAFNITTNVNFGADLSFLATQDPTNVEGGYYEEDASIPTLLCLGDQREQLFIADVYISNGNFDFVLGHFKNGAYKGWPGEKPSIEKLAVYLKSTYPEFAAYGIGEISYKGSGK